MLIREARIEELDKVMAFYEMMCRELASKDFLPNGNKGGFPSLEMVTEAIKNSCLYVGEENGEIEFLRKIVPGGASKSYGIQVAKMAGLPNSVVKRSEELMSKMQRDFSKNLAGRKKSTEPEIEAPQLNLF